MNNKDIERQIKTMYDVSNVRSNYFYWFNKLLNFCLPIMKYENLPDTIPAREIESRLIITCHADFIPKNGKLYVMDSEPYDYDEYMNPTKATYFNIKLGSGNVTYGRSAEVVYNNSLKYNVMGLKSDGGLYTLIAKYSATLAHIESTANIYAVNNRSTFLPVAKSDSVAASLKKFFGSLFLGKREIISDDYILDQVKSIDIGTNKTNDNEMSWLQARDKVLEQFFRDIGVKFSNQKKENLTTDEVNSNDQLLLISWDDMLNERKEGIERVNKLFGTNISVNINPKYIVKGVNDNGYTDFKNKFTDGSGRYIDSPRI